MSFGQIERVGRRGGKKEIPSYAGAGSGVAEEKTFCPCKRSLAFLVKKRTH